MPSWNPYADPETMPVWDRREWQMCFTYLAALLRHTPEMRDLMERRQLEREEMSERHFAGEDLMEERHDRELVGTPAEWTETEDAAHRGPADL